MTGICYKAQISMVGQATVCASGKASAASIPYAMLTLAFRTGHW